MVKLYEKNTLNNYDQIKVDYGYNESINSNTFAEKFSECNLMIFRGHGGYSGESYLLLTPILTNGEYSESTATKYYSTDMSDIDVSNISCALFICCNSAQGSYSNQSISNFVTEGIENGINCVIGFDDTVYCSYAAEFLDTFLELYTGINNNDEHIDGGGTSYNVAFRQTINILGADNNMPFLSTQSYKIYYSDGLITEYYDE